MDSPFKQLIAECESAIWSDHSGSLPNRDAIILVSSQLRFLHVQYAELATFRFASASTLAGRELTVKAVSDFVNLIGTLSQFARILKKRLSINIPLQDRIRFYRNKVSEHWEEYTEHALTGSLIQIGDYPPIPSIAFEHRHEERIKLKMSLDEVLGDFGISNPEVGNIMDVQGNPDRLYIRLEQIYPGLEKVPPKVVELLFKFGFPSPIQDLERYCHELADFLSRKLFS